MIKRSYFLLFSTLLVSGIFLSACAPESNTITVATDANWEPFEFLDTTTYRIVGFDIDLMNAVAEAVGLQIEYFDVRWTPLLDGMAQCEYDAAISSITVTEERSQQFLFSDPYLAAGQIVVVGAANTDILGRDDLSGKVVGAQLDTTGEEQARAISGAEVRTYEDISLAFIDLMNNLLDAVIADSPLALTYVGKDPDLFKTVGDVFTDEVYAIAVCKTNPGLLERINRGLATVKAEGLVEDLIQTWIFKK